MLGILNGAEQWCPAKGGDCLSEVYYYRGFAVQCIPKAMEYTKHLSSLAGEGTESQNQLFTGKMEEVNAHFYYKAASSFPYMCIPKTHTRSYTVIWVIHYPHVAHG